ncbi:MAG: hypothetical protein Q8908_15315 [Bacteroidota bacterium]|nr:hypothetical protein [Bacteroidota bacterium]
MKNTDFKTTLKATIFTFFALIGMNCSAVHAANAVGENASDSSFQVTVTTGNNQITQGKKLATDAYYLKPAIHYSYKQGFYIDLSGNYIPDFKKNSFSSMNVGTGYNFDLGNNISTGIDYS